ncbi:hypothetical protein [Henriciella litoralis]|uniref:hypothetical protein n=1 Tax=Henriciella litoralis TaxID=568102 RepID=UPI0009FFAB71|nr:hypothetical protein [Henriciella litoralis]
MSVSDTPRIRRHYGGQISIFLLVIMLAGVVALAVIRFGPNPAAALSLSAAPSSSQSTETIVDTSDDENDAGGTEGTDANVRDFSLIVRFEEGVVPDAVTSRFRVDPVGARETYSEWAADKPALKGLRLERADLTGELVLVSNGERTLGETIAAIGEMKGLSYVEQQE